MKLIKVKLDSLIFWYRSDDKVIGERIALGKYEEFETRIFLKQLKPEMVVVDVGANIGYYTLLAAKKVKRVYAIEPDKECFEILKENIEANNLKNVILINKAVGNENKKVRIKKNLDNFGDSKISESGDLIECTRLDDIVREKIDLLKVDVQGFEPQVVEGARELIKKFSPIIFLEYNGNEYKDESMIKFLRKTYEVIFNIDHWYYVYWRNNGKIKLNKRIGYANLWMKKEVGVQDFIDGVTSVQIKKVIKAIMSLYGKNK